MVGFRIGAGAGNRIKNSQNFGSGTKSFRIHIAWFGAVLRIRIRSDPDLFAGSGSGQIVRIRIRLKIFLIYNFKK